MWPDFRKHHLVEAVLQGNSGNRLPMTLMVDTGASLPVLPYSAAEALGLEPEQLQQRTLQTAKGEMQAKIGKVKEVRLGDARVADVEVALVDDEQLGGMALLGMNVLSRYLFVLDDEKSQLILIPQEKSE